MMAFDDNLVSPPAISDRRRSGEHAAQLRCPGSPALARTFTCHRHKLRPGSTAAVEHWRQEMNRRMAELKATLGPEGIALEVVLIEHADDGDYLIFVIECDDYDKAVSVYGLSNAAIDNFHRNFLAENVIDRQKLEVAYWAEP